MPKVETPEKIQELPVAIIKNIIMLSTSGFGVVVALAWNEVIKSFVEQYIAPYLGEGSGVVSLFIYALVVTLLAIVVTMQLSGLQRRLERLHGAVTHAEAADAEKSSRGTKSAASQKRKAD